VTGALVPLQDIAKLIPRINPRFKSQNAVYVMLTEFIGSYPVAGIGIQIAGLSVRADDITAATDFLFQGS
jgi:toxin CcdB